MNIRIGIGYYRRKILGLLKHQTPKALYELLWNVNALQNGYKEKFGFYPPDFDFPQGADSEDISSMYKIHPWELEALSVMILVNYNNSWGKRRRILDTKKF